MNNFNKIRDLLRVRRGGFGKDDQELLNLIKDYGQDQHDVGYTQGWDDARGE